MALIGIDASRANARVKTGTEWYSYALTRALTSLDHANTYRLYAKTPLSQGLQHLGPHVSEKVLGWPPKRLWTQLRLSLEMAVHPPDVLFVPAHTIPLFHPRNTVTTLHDVGFARSPQLYARKELLYHRWSTRFALKSAAKIITPSQFTKQEIIDLYGVSPERLVVVHHGFDPDRYRVLEDTSQFSTVLAKYGIVQPFLLYIGRLQEKKNTPGLVRSFGMLSKRLPSKRLQLVLVGQRDFHFDHVEAAIREFHLQEQVVLPGYVPADDLPTLLNTCALFVFPSLYEGFGFPVLEAQACGAPVLTSDVASLPEVGGDGAYYVRPTDTDALAVAMERLLTDETLRAALREKGFRNLQRFTWEACAKETLSVLETVANR